MYDPFALMLAGCFGLLLGLAFFGSLWWTVRSGLRQQAPGALFLISTPLRLAVTLVVFYWVGGHDWPKLVACLIGFSMIRIALIALPVARPAVPLVRDNGSKP
jgi:F1F0 ATPase subunit 2